MNVRIAFLFEAAQYFIVHSISYVTFLCLIMDSLIASTFGELWTMLMQMWVLKYLSSDFQFLRMCPETWDHWMLGLLWVEVKSRHLWDEF